MIGKYQNLVKTLRGEHTIWTLFTYFGYRDRMFSIVMGFQTKVKQEYVSHDLVTCSICLRYIIKMKSPVQGDAFEAYNEIV